MRLWNVVHGYVRVRQEPVRRLPLGLARENRRKRGTGVLPAHWPNICAERGPAFPGSGRHGEAKPDSPHPVLTWFTVSVRSSGDDPCFPAAADALDAAVNGCPERAPRELRNRAGVPQIL